MPKLKYKRKGKLISAWLPHRQHKIWHQIENKSKFIQLCLDDAAGIMAWQIYKEKERLKVTEKPLESVIEEYNKTFPLDPLTKKRLKKEPEEEWPKNSPKKRELW